MKLSTSSSLPENLCWLSTLGLSQKVQWGERWSDRQERVAGFDQEKVRKACVWLAGCNGLNRTTAEFLVRKGYGKIGIADDDIVEVSNLNRTLWKPDAIGKLKVIQAARELCEIAPARTEIMAFVGRVEEVFDTPIASDANAFIIGIDNDRGRAAATIALRRMQVPAVFVALSADTHVVEVFVQEVDGACWACAHPESFRQAVNFSPRTPCPRVPSISDSALVGVGFTCFALDSLLMDRPRNWNLRVGTLHGELKEYIVRLPRNPKCPACGASAV